MRNGGKRAKHHREVAADLLGEGYYNTSISDIMAATGLAKGGLYSHFDSKEALWNTPRTGGRSRSGGSSFTGVRKVSDPLDRISGRSNDLRDSCCGEVFEGGYFFFQHARRTLGPVPAMSAGWSRFMQFCGPSGLWLEEARSERQTQARREDKGGRKPCRHLHQRRDRVDVATRNTHSHGRTNDRAQLLHPDAEGLRKGNRGAPRILRVFPGDTDRSPAIRVHGDPDPMRRCRRMKERIRRFVVGQEIDDVGSLRHRTTGAPVAPTRSSSPGQGRSSCSPTRETRQRLR